MWLFIQQYRKMLILCAIPIIAAAAFFGYRYVHAQSGQNEAYAVNDQMQTLLEEVDQSTPAPTLQDVAVSPVSDNGIESAPPGSNVNDSETAALIKAHQLSPEPKPSAIKTTSKPKPTLKPVHTPKPKATAKPKATPKPKPAATPKATVKPRASAKSSPIPNPNIKISLNKATLDELMTLPLVGESKAKAIIAYRDQVKVFKSIDEVVEVKGIGPHIFEKIKDRLEL